MKMGESKLQTICGLKVVDAEFIISDTGLLFENGIRLVIYNKFDLVGISHSDVKQLIGKAVCNVDEGEHLITIFFEKNVAIEIDMRDDAYSGPESIQLLIPGEPIIIWN
jgi:hypothetical protein